MGQISPTQVSPNDQITAASVNTPVNQIANVVNGNIDASNITDGSITYAKLADSRPHYTSLYYSTGGPTGGQVIPANSERPCAFDEVDTNTFGVTVNLNDVLYNDVNYRTVTITRSGIYNLNAYFRTSDGSANNYFIVWFEVSPDGGVAFQRMRFYDKSINTSSGESYSVTHYLPAGARVRVSMYYGSTPVRIGSSDNTFNSRYYFGPKFTITEIR